MPILPTSQLFPPKDWQEFETLCCDLWARIWGYPNTQKNGRQGQAQAGVDVFGMSGDNRWAGVQCKGKDSYADKCVTRTELQTAVEAAKAFEPKLAEFILATTGPKDASLEQLAREITQAHQGKGLFSVHVFGWEDIYIRLLDYPELVAKYYSFVAQTEHNKQLNEALSAFKHTVAYNHVEVMCEISAVRQDLKSTHTPLLPSPEIAVSRLASEYNAELDHARALLRDFKPHSVISLLTGLRSRMTPDLPIFIRYRLLTNLGCAYLDIGEERQAASLFIESLQYNPDDEGALCNAATAYILTGQPEQARALANKVLERNPASGKAYSLLTQTQSDTSSLEDAIALVPEPWRHLAEVAYTIGHKARKAARIRDAQQWFQIAVDNDKESRPELFAAIGETLLQEITEDEGAFYCDIITEKQNAQLQQARNWLDKAWEKIANTELRALRTVWVLNRGLAKKMLGDIDGALQDTDIALESQPDNPHYKYRKALLLHEKGRNRDAITLLTTIQDAAISRLKLVLADLLRQEKEYDRAAEVLQDFLATAADGNAKKEAQRLLVQIYVEQGEGGKAEALLAELRSENPTDVKTLVDAARLVKKYGRRQEAISLLAEASSYVDGDTPPTEIMYLTDELYALEQFKEAARFYEKIVAKDVYSLATHKLIVAYYRSGDMSKALELCVSIRAKHGPIESISDIESAVYEEIGDLDKAREVCGKYLDAFPNNLGMKLRLAIINYRSDKLAELDSFLDEVIKIEDLSLEEGLRLAFLHKARGRWKKALDILYEMRRRYYDKSDSHLNYVRVFFTTPAVEGDKSLLPDRAAVGTAVCIKDEEGKSEWYVIEDRYDADLQRREIGRDHPLAQAIIGKAAGERILLRPSPVRDEYGELVEIKSKYVYALHESMRLFETIFPGVPGLHTVKLGEPKDEGAPPEGIQLILDQISRQYDLRLKIEQLYSEGRFTIGAIASCTGHEVPEVWGALIQRSDVGIRCSVGNPEEREEALATLREKQNIIVDMIAILTIHGLEISDVISKAFGKLLVSQSTRDAIWEYAEKLKSMPTGRMMLLGKERDGFVRREVTAEDLRQSLDHFEKILRWIDEWCEIKPCRAALEMNRDEKNRLDELLGQSFVDSILIAKEYGAVLYSDDQSLRLLGKTEHKIKGTWTQAVLMHCLDQDVIDQGTYNKLVVRLACYHYYHTSVSAEVLIEAARLADWLPAEPYATVVQNLGGSRSDESSAIMVGGSFIYQLWREPIITRQRDYLVMMLLDALTSGRHKRSVLLELKKEVRRQLVLWPRAIKEILGAFAAWERVHVV